MKTKFWNNHKCNETKGKEGHYWGDILLNVQAGDIVCDAKEKLFQCTQAEYHPRTNINYFVRFHKLNKDWSVDYENQGILYNFREKGEEWTKTLEPKNNE